MLKRTTINRCTLKRNRDGKVNILLFGDIHYGAKTCDYAFLKKVISIAEKNGWYLFGMGDYLEYATRHSVGSGCYEQSIRPQEQKEDLIDMLMPLSKGGRVIGLLEGNHENRATQSVDSNPVRDICIALNAPYLGYSGYNLLIVGKQSYTSFATHGVSNARNDVTKLSAANRETQHRIVDMIWYGHTHGLAETSVPLEFIDKRNKAKLSKRKLIFLTGSTLEYDTSYADDTGLLPAETGLFLVTLDGKSFDISYKKIVK